MKTRNDVGCQQGIQPIEKAWEVLCEEFSEYLNKVAKKPTMNVDELTSTSYTIPEDIVDQTIEKLANISGTSIESATYAVNSLLTPTRYAELEFITREMPEIPLDKKIRNLKKQIKHAKSLLERAHYERELNELYRQRKKERKKKGGNQ